MLYLAAFVWLFVGGIGFLLLTLKFLLLVSYIIQILKKLKLDILLYMANIIQNKMGTLPHVSLLLILV